MSQQPVVSRSLVLFLIKLHWIFLNLKSVLGLAIRQYPNSLSAH
jgi:hypothetical protein